MNKQPSHEPCVCVWGGASTSLSARVWACVSVRGHVRVSLCAWQLPARLAPPDSKGLKEAGDADRRADVARHLRPRADLAVPTKRERGADRVVFGPRGDGEARERRERREGLAAKAKGSQAAEVVKPGEVDVSARGPCVRGQT